MSGRDHFDVDSGKGGTAAELVADGVVDTPPIPVDGSDGDYWGSSRSHGPRHSSADVVVHRTDAGAADDYVAVGAGAAVVHSSDKPPSRVVHSGCCCGNCRRLGRTDHHCNRSRSADYASPSPPDVPRQCARGRCPPISAYPVGSWSPPGPARGAEDSPVIDAA